MNTLLIVGSVMMIVFASVRLVINSRRWRGRDQTIGQPVHQEHSRKAARGLVLISVGMICSGLARLLYVTNHPYVTTHLSFAIPLLLAGSLITLIGTVVFFRHVAAIIKRGRQSANRSESQS